MNLPIIYKDQRDQGDGVTVENTDLQNIIGWGETPDEAMQNLTDQTQAVIESFIRSEIMLNNMEY